MNNGRTLLTDEYLKGTKEILQSIINICDDVTKMGVSWNSACDVRGLDPKKTRIAVLKTLPNCKGNRPALADIPDNTLDGYEKFYNAVFGERVTDATVLPYDYKESVKRVLDNIDSVNADIIMRYFGICKYENEPMTYRQIAETVNISHDAARHMADKGLRECWIRENHDILRQGSEKYDIVKKQKQAYREKELAHISKIHEMVMEKLSALYREQISDAGDDPFYMIFRECKETPYKKLESMLSVRAANALRRSSAFIRPNTVYDLIMLDLKGIMSARNIGTATAFEIMEVLDVYLDERYGLSAVQLRKRFGSYIYSNDMLDPEACGSCEHREGDRCMLQEPCPYND